MNAWIWLKQRRQHKQTLQYTFYLVAYCCSFQVIFHLLSLNYFFSYILYLVYYLLSLYYFFHLVYFIIIIFLPMLLSSYLGFLIVGSCCVLFFSFNCNGIERSGMKHEWNEKKAHDKETNQPYRHPLIQESFVLFLHLPSRFLVVLF